MPKPIFSRFAALIVVAAVLLAAACSTVPVTGRQQLDLVSSQQLSAMSSDAYRQFMAEHKVVTGTPDSQMVQSVGERIKTAVEDYLSEIGRAGLVADFQWEFNLVEDDSKNAWAMPGGKVAVYTGILSVTRDETGLAVVMGHEVAHVVAQHGSERMSQGLLTQLGGAALSVALSSNPRQTQELFMAAYGVGAQVGVLLPYSRLHESEADRLGLIFMAEAGYDPRAAVDFWRRMAGSSGSGGAPPEFLSTHPAAQTRIDDLKKHLPAAMEHYRKASAKDA
jgi:predicted Zn-dependent protease